MELKNMTVEELEARKAAIASEIDAPEADLNALEEEARAINAELDERKNEFDEIWPSHADIPVSTDTIKLLYEGAQDILAGKVSGTPEELFGNKITAYDLGFCTILGER